MRLNPTKEILKHRSFVVAVIVSESVFVEVILQVLGADMAIHTIDTAFDIAPEAVNGLSVNIAADANPLGV